MPDMPVLMMSGHAFNIQESDLLIAGATMFLSKPFSLFELAQAVHRLLNVASPANPDESSS
jgi:DNA-binding response OmpR family regulator